MHRAVVDSVLGPGMRAVVWVQGCNQRCPGCIAPEGWDPGAGEPLSPGELADWILGEPGLEGVTISGGEPMLQAAALAQVVRQVRSRADLGVICYTGYVAGEPGPDHPGIPLDATPDTLSLLEQVDLLIDGPYLAERHGDLLLRGSFNQRLLQLTHRYREWLAATGSDRSLGVSVLLDEEGRPQVVGVPNRPGFRGEFERTMAGLGVHLAWPCGDGPDCGAAGV